MTAEAANTTVTVFRGTTTNAFGDTIDTNTPLVSMVPAVLIETGRNTSDPSSQTPRTIREVVCHVPPWVGVLATDRIYDETTRETYIIVGVTRPPTLIGAPVDETLQLKRVTAQGT